MSTDINLCVSNEQKPTEEFSISHTESNNISNDRNPNNHFNPNNHIQLIPKEDVISNTVNPLDPIGTILSDLPDYLTDLEQDKLYIRQINITEAKKQCGCPKCKDNNHNAKSTVNFLCQLENHEDPKCINYRIYKKIGIPIRQYLNDNEKDPIPYGNMLITVIPHNLDDVKYNNDQYHTAQTPEEYDTQHNRFDKIKAEIRHDPNHYPCVTFWGSKSIFIINYISNEQLETKCRNEIIKKGLHFNPIQIRYMVDKTIQDIANYNEHLFQHLALDYVFWDVDDKQLSYMKEKSYDRFTAINIKKKWKQKKKLPCGVSNKDGRTYVLRIGEKNMTKEEYEELKSQPIQYNLEYRDVTDERLLYALDDPDDLGRLVNIREFVKLVNDKMLLVEWNDTDPSNWQLSNWKAYFGERSKNLLYELKNQFEATASTVPTT